MNFKCVCPGIDGANREGIACLGVMLKYFPTLDLALKYIGKRGCINSGKGI
jgi:hypothetical protein